tara:strand:- start:50 stop:235 length:186 start_codon:yes stop_codon:yes gene_type:complete
VGLQTLLKGNFTLSNSAIKMWHDFYKFNQECFEMGIEKNSKKQNSPFALYSMSQGCKTWAE